MATIDLLSAVLPTEGWYCILGLTQTGSPRQIFVQTIQEAEAEIDRLLAQKCDMYFACAGVSTPSGC